MDMEWAHELRNKCAAGRIAYFFKQDADTREARLVEAHGRKMQYRQFPAN